MYVVGFLPCSIKSFLLVPVILKQIPTLVNLRIKKINVAEMYAKMVPKILVLIWLAGLSISVKTKTPLY